MILFNFSYRFLIFGFISICVLSISMQVFAQNNDARPHRGFLIHPSGGFGYPGRDLASRFGSHGELGIDMFYKTRSNWLIGSGVQFMFGNTIKENPLARLYTPEGLIISSNGTPAQIRIEERGMRIGILKAGRIVSLPIYKGLDPQHSGIILLLGLGMMQHRFRFDDVSKNTLQLRNDYKKGYDRLTNGFMSSQTIGYLFMGKQHRLNVFIMAEFAQGFTRSRRSYDFQTMKLSDNAMRLDLTSSFRIGWILPLYAQEDTDEYTN